MYLCACAPIQKKCRLRDAEFEDNKKPRSTEPVTITYPTYKKIIHYIKKDDNKYDLLEKVFRKDMSEEIERRKALPRFYKGEMAKQLHFVRVDVINTQMGDTQVQIEKTEETKLVAGACRTCGGPHFTAKCTRSAVAYTPKDYKLSTTEKHATDLNIVSDFCFSIRVSNLPRNCTEDDWKKTIQLLQENVQFRIRMIGIRKGNFNGTCIVLYKSKADADRGLRIFNRMKYGTSILDCAPADDNRR